MAYVKKFIMVLAVFVLLVVGLNWQYFQAQIDFYRNPPQIREEPLPPMGEPNKIWIQTLGIEAPLVYIEGTTQADFQNALHSGVVHYPGTAQPGESGNAYYFGHSSDVPGSPGRYKTVFALLPKIENGAVVEVTDKNGKLFRYMVDRQFDVGPKDLSVLEQDHSKKQLTLQTSYPVGTALRRYIVVSYLIK